MANRQYGDLTFVQNEEQRRRFEKLLSARQYGTSEQVRVLQGWMGTFRLKQLNDYLEDIGLE